MEGEPKEDRMTIDIGHNAPDLRLTDENERDIDLPVAAGPTVLIFYRGDW